MNIQEPVTEAMKKTYFLISLKLSFIHPVVFVMTGEWTTAAVDPRENAKLDQKAAIIKTVAARAKKTQLAKDFRIAPSTLSTIFSSKEAITGAAGESCGLLL